MLNKSPNMDFFFSRENHTFYYETKTNKDGVTMLIIGAIMIAVGIVLVVKGSN